MNHSKIPIQLVTLHNSVNLSKLTLIPPFLFPYQRTNPVLVGCFVSGDGPGDGDILVEGDTVFGEDKFERVLNVAGDLASGVKLWGAADGEGRKVQRRGERERTKKSHE